MPHQLLSGERIAKLLGSTFCNPCPQHAGLSDSTAKFFCIDCVGGTVHALCTYCQINHAKKGPGHRMLQVRISSGHEVIRVSDLDGIDITRIHRYVINSAEVVFLRRREDPPPLKHRRYGSVSICDTCTRALASNARFCSVECKLQTEGRNPLRGILVRPHRVPGKRKGIRQIIAAIEHAHTTTRRRKGQPRRLPFF